ncbi:carbohydrate ABC transporter permease [Streptomyces cocklensis]|jgi:arabinogalactan oligomer/maltooligosaccharide transport system permease protein|uniref:Arabinogalactan oligomer / maltooligosaccharide transport system permease protein n=1 Tax=Actinacidiphila cocklensis TaxID=887465 RepID=A0A9W4E8F6_9ACTN|nr:carbohydrate ABC transporter permease [Actinacidiphila cocklensis]MDD1062272.1 carbohydrate ABC transporter permease [Actinacidiphila cocklensis]WSX74160.1 carbohydrate ABC transporter permease [Streptomyces sp. NBC_00899]WSX79776.1 carbohydrate ABC transporter permease [Streptomyces sp. NBC_00899]CAG6395474.1 Arabinogalactan oligomer / maltooligosaccharide transport system permease protein [Actinacidiphila cocklensis]
MSATTHSGPAATTTSSRGTAAERHRGRGERSRGASIALHAALITASAIAVFPVLWILFISLGPSTSWQQPHEVLKHLGLANYRFVLLHTSFPKWFLNSVIVAGATTVLGVLISASAGYAISRMRFPGHKSLMWTFLVTQMFPMAVLIVPLYNLLAQLDLIDTYLGLVLVYCTIAVPFCAWMLKGYFDTIPRDIDEAGRVDGLTPFGTFWRLIVPLARPGLAVTAFYSFLTAWGEVAYSAQFMGRDHSTLAAGIRTFASDQRADWGSMTAASVLIAIPATIVFLLVQRHLVTGLTAGGTKG